MGINLSILKKIFLNKYAPTLFSLLFMAFLNVSDPHASFHEEDPQNKKSWTGSFLAVTSGTLATGASWLFGPSLDDNISETLIGTFVKSQGGSFSQYLYKNGQEMLEALGIGDLASQVKQAARKDMLDLFDRCMFHRSSQKCLEATKILGEGWVDYIYLKALLYTYGPPIAIGVGVGISVFLGYKLYQKWKRSKVKNS